MTREERNKKLKYLITCMKCEVSGKCCDENCLTQYDAGNMGEIIENLEAISKALEQKPKTEWIPVSKRLPENGYYLWCAKGGEIQKDYYWNGHWKIAEEYGYEVTAWMSLPEPYKAESEVQE